MRVDQLKNQLTAVIGGRMAAGQTHDRGLAVPLGEVTRRSGAGGGKRSERPKATLGPGR